VLVLPISFFGYGSIGIRGVGDPMDSLSRPMVSWKFFLKVWQNAFSAINRPDG
jgi:hypothetical protein